METRLSVQEFDDDREDDAPRVVLVHGVMDRGASFGRVVGYLHDVVVVTYDRRGYAHSMGLPLAETVGTHVEDLVAVLGDKPSTVVGHSLGGVVALAAAALRPDLVRSVGVYESPMPWLDWWPTSTAGARTLAEDSDPAAAAETFMRYLAGDQAWDTLPMKTQQQRRAEGPALLADLESLHAATPPFEPAGVTVPVAVAGGSLTQDHHKQGCEAMAKTFNTDVQWIDGAGHGGHMSHPGPFASFVRRCIGIRNP
ncbi:MAG TPA: alpha/beta hydrolase [Acidimicrobiales bacterium]|nr:alpha/beta hydrolase [Acidimicrobiales bacterium]